VKVKFRRPRGACGAESADKPPASCLVSLSQVRPPPVLLEPEYIKPPCRGASSWTVARQAPLPSRILDEHVASRNVNERASKEENQASCIRLVRPISDDFKFGLANPGFNFGLSEPVCGCTRACITCVARGSSPGATSDATLETSAHEQPQTALTESGIRSRVCQSEIKIIRNWAHQSYIICAERFRGETILNVPVSA
jgi:hypothetical protein